MTRIPYGPIVKVPSWSWMAYNGGIDFVVKEEFGHFEGYRNLKFLKEQNSLAPDLQEFTGCDLEEEEGGPAATSCKLVELSGSAIGWISYDVEIGQDFCLIQCAVIGRLWDQKTQV